MQHRPRRRAPLAAASGRGTWPALSPPLRGDGECTVFRRREGHFATRWDFPLGQGSRQFTGSRVNSLGHAAPSPAWGRRPAPSPARGRQLGPAAFPAPSGVFCPPLRGDGITAGQLRATLLCGRTACVAACSRDGAGAALSSQPAPSRSRRAPRLAGGVSRDPRRYPILKMEKRTGGRVEASSALRTEAEAE